MLKIFMRFICHLNKIVRNLLVIKCYCVFYFCLCEIKKNNSSQKKSQSNCHKMRKLDDNSIYLKKTGSENSGWMRPIKKG